MTALSIKPKFIMRIKLSAYGKLAYSYEADVHKAGKIVCNLPKGAIGEPDELLDGQEAAVQDLG